MTAAVGAVAKEASEKKVAASQAAKKAASSSAKSGEKSARTAADREARLKRVAAARARAESKKASGPGSPEKKTSESGTKPEAPAQKKSATQRAASGAKSSAKRSVESAKQSHKKTASAVDSKYRRDRVLGLAEMRPKTRMLAAEYMAAIVMAIILLFIHRDGEKTYHQRMSRFFVQMTGITGIFFVLSLGSSSERVSRYAVPFGLLIDVSMLVYLFKEGGSKFFSQATGGLSPEEDLKLHDQLPADSALPELIAPGLVVSPGDVSAYGNTLGGRVPGNIIVTPGGGGVDRGLFPIPPPPDSNNVPRPGGRHPFS